MSGHLPLIAVVRGGYSGESVISHQSARTMMDAIDKTLYDAVFITIDRETWSCQDEQDAPLKFDRGVMTVREGKHVDMALIAIHGPPGEDGKLQGFLDVLGVPYHTGDVLNMALTFSKSMTCAALRDRGFRVAPSVVVQAIEDADTQRILEETGLPCFVKPDESGSSLGISKVKEASALRTALELAFKESELVLVEGAVQGRELTCGVLRVDGVVRALPICEVRTSHEFFDYEAKYHAMDTEEIIPAPIEDTVRDLCQERSMAIYEALGCRGMVRVDHFWDGEHLTTIEVNTTPGFSAASIFPKMLKAEGLAVDQVINGIIAAGLARGLDHEARQRPS